MTDDMQWITYGDHYYIVNVKGGTSEIEIHEFFEEEDIPGTSEIVFGEINNALDYKIKYKNRKKYNG